MTGVKILHILYSGQGGLGSYFMNFVKSDTVKDFKHFAFFYGNVPLHNEYEFFCRECGIEFVYLERKSKWDSSAFKACRKFIADYSIEVALLHTFSMTPFYFRSKKGFKVYAIDHTSAKFKTTIEWIFTGLNHLMADKTVYFYQDQFRSVKEKLPFLRNGRNITYVPKTVNTDFFSPAVSKRKNKTFRLGMASRLVPGKRHELLLEAVKSLLDQQVTVELLIAGLGPNVQALKAFISDYGLTGHVKLLGNLTQQELTPFYQSLDSYVHASDGETICYSIMEAESCELPILASNVEGINTVIEHGKQGYLFENNTESIADTIIVAKKNRSTLTEMGRFNRLEMVEQERRHNPARAIKALIEQ